MLYNSPRLAIYLDKARCRNIRHVPYDMQPFVVICFNVVRNQYTKYSCVFSCLYFHCPFPGGNRQCWKKIDHDDVTIWEHFVRYWSFFRVIYLSPVDSPYKSQWCGALIFSLIWAWTNLWANSRDAGDLRCHSTRCDETIMQNRAVPVHDKKCKPQNTCLFAYNVIVSFQVCEVYSNNIENDTWLWHALLGIAEFYGRTTTINYRKPLMSLLEIYMSVSFRTSEIEWNKETGNSDLFLFILAVDLVSDQKIRSQFSTWHESQAVVTWGKLWPDLIIFILVRTTFMFWKFG